MHDIPFVDAHVHFWDLDAIAHPWLTPPFSTDGLMGSVEAIATDYGPEEYAADAQRWTVAGTVHVDAGAAPELAVDESRWLDGLRTQHGAPTAMVAFAALNAPAVEETLAAHAGYSAVRGIRHIVNYHDDPYRTYTPVDLTVDPQWQAGFAKLAGYGLGFDLQAYPSQFAPLVPLLSAHEDIPVMINHAGMPFHDEKEEWRKGMAALAALPHCAVKVSGFGITDHDWTEESIRPYVLETIDLFGTDRVMFASDFPTDKLYADFDRCLSSYANIIAAFSDDEKRAMWGRNADRLYRMGLSL
ncbi:amidohydrolase family protein [Parvularcula flava]|uniref:Amidohydrolase family protein n=1 Tax=Aquisalinus luteolus TaxID=1566827 RepID=A0A8J3ENX6_9PROT|nr:amidohydrolase family protein [Aquisalinus luteolus]NHK26422.1 amidohydrolase family protein [Aquisalinus luteolus]GGH92287.1 hypothetical protein GCM10011355_01430 [Aquisalinus luteolus]